MLILYYYCNSNDGDFDALKGFILKVETSLKGEV